MEKKLTRRESRETAFLTAFAATFEPEEPTLCGGASRARCLCKPAAGCHE